MNFARTALSLLLLSAGGSVAQQPPAAPAQPPARATPSFLGPCSDLACEIEHDWSRDNAVFYMLAGAMPDDKFGYKPTPEEQTFGERVLHVAQVNLDLLKTLGAKAPPPVIDPKATSKAASMAAVQKVGEYGVAVIKEFSERQLTERVASPWFMGPMASRQRILYFLMAHNQDTYGQLAVYLRLNGITPPLSRTP